MSRACFRHRVHLDRLYDQIENLFKKSSSCTVRSILRIPACRAPTFQLVAALRRALADSWGAPPQEQRWWCFTSLSRPRRVYRLGARRQVLDCVHFQLFVEPRRCHQREMICASRWFKLVYVGRSMYKARWQMSCGSSSNIITVTSVFSSKESVDKMVPYGSMIAVSICGQTHTVTLTFGSFP